MRTVTNLFSTVITFVLLFTACTDKNTREDAIRRIVNETEFNVKIEVFSDEHKYIYHISQYDSIDIEGYCEGPRYKHCMLGWSDLPNGRIYFGDDKVQKFEDPSGDENKYINGDPIFGRFGYVLSNENGIEVYTYRITPEDYENAEACNGDCE